MYPNHVIKLISLLEGQHEGQNGTITYIRKKGSQQTTNTPMIIPKVLAALRSFDKLIRCFSSMNWYSPPTFFGGSITTTLEPGFLLLEFTTVMVAQGVEFLRLLISFGSLEVSPFFWEFDEFSPEKCFSLTILYQQSYTWWTNENETSHFPAFFFAVEI